MDAPNQTLFKIATVRLLFNFQSICTKNYFVIAPTCLIIFFIHSTTTFGFTVSPQLTALRFDSYLRAKEALRTQILKECFFSSNICFSMWITTELLCWIQNSLNMFECQDSQPVCFTMQHLDEECYIFSQYFPIHLILTCWRNAWQVENR